MVCVALGKESRPICMYTLGMLSNPFVMNRVYISSHKRKDCVDGGNNTSRKRENRAEILVLMIKSVRVCAPPEGESCHHSW